MTNLSPVWSVNYMPHSLNDICGREQIKSQLTDYISKKNFPHLLLTGHQGVGKTTIARCFAKEFLGDFFSSNFKMLYADAPISKEERIQAGIKTTFSKSMIGSRAGKKKYIHPFLDIKVKPFVQIKALGDVPFKILIVKNFEALGQFQHGFRRLMETHGSNCRVLIITTRISSIIDPIISRCQILFVPPVDFKNFKDLIEDISTKESFTVDDPTIRILYKYSQAQINTATNLLQIAAMKTPSINSEIIYEVIDKSRNKKTSQLLKVIYKGDFSKARGLMRDIRREYNYSAQEIFKQMMDEMIIMPIAKRVKIQFINYIADADFGSIDGMDADIQLSNLISKMCLFSVKL